MNEKKFIVTIHGINLSERPAIFTFFVMLALSGFIGLGVYLTIYVFCSLFNSWWLLISWIDLVVLWLITSIILTGYVRWIITMGMKK